MKGNPLLEINPQLMIIFFFCLLGFTMILFYLLLVSQSNQRFRKWPLYRTLCWSAGIFIVTIVMSRLLSKPPHFIEHMLHHLLLGMLAPLLLVLSSPMTLLLRSLSVTHARRITKILKRPLITIYHHPMIASLLNIGGMWLIYQTDLHYLFHHHLLISFLIHAHFLFAGYLFTASMISFDPNPHRYSFRYRAMVLIFALAGHAILSKWIYAHPPLGVSMREAEIGGMMMYYGGDLIDFVIIYLLCYEQYHITRLKFPIQRDATRT